MEQLKKIITLLHWHIKVKGNGNKYNRDILLKNDIRLRIKGDNNQIIIGDDCSLKNVVISIYGNNNVVTIGNNIQTHGLTVEIGFMWHNKANNTNLSIGNKTTINGATIIMLEDDSQVKIGENCMFACDVELWATDTHSITDLEDNLINYGGNIQIGNNVWIGKDVKICKKAQISDDTVVGFNSVVASKFQQSNVILAGNPAKIIKENIKWNRLSPQNYQQQQNKNKVVANVS